MDNAERLFNEIVKEYSERVYWHVRRFVNNHEDADDLVQEIFLKIWTALPSFRGEAQLFTWVYRIATNETLNWLRREKVRSALRFPWRNFRKNSARSSSSGTTMKCPTSRCRKCWTRPSAHSKPPFISRRKKSAHPSGKIFSSVRIKPSEKARV